MPEAEHRRAELDLIRALLVQAGLERDEEELASLLPWFWAYRESGARILESPILGMEPQVVFDPRWLA